MRAPLVKESLWELSNLPSIVIDRKDREGTIAYIKKILGVVQRDDLVRLFILDLNEVSDWIKVCEVYGRMANRRFRAVLARKRSEWDRRFHR